MTFIKNLILFALLAVVTLSLVTLSFEKEPEKQEISKILKYEDIKN